MWFREATFTGSGVDLLRRSPVTHFNIPLTKASLTVNGPAKLKKPYLGYQPKRKAGTPDVKGGRGSESVREWWCKSNHEKIVPARLLYIKEEEIGKVIIKHKNELKFWSPFLSNRYHTLTYC